MSGGLLASRSDFGSEARRFDPYPDSLYAIIDAMTKVFNGSTWIDTDPAKDQDLVDIAALAPTNNDFLQRKAGAWTNRTPSQAKTDLALTKTDVGLSNVDNTSDVNKPLSTPVKSFLRGPLNLDAASGNGILRSTYPPVAIGNDAAYAAFPGVVQLPSGRLRMVWRQGTDHVASHDGVIKTATSDDLGRTWSAATTLYSDGTAPDVRDPSISISPDGTKVYLTFFKSNSGSVAQGMFFAVSTDGGASFGTPVRMDASLVAGAITAPVVDPGTGTLYAVGYAKSGAETQYSSWLFTSTNGGTSWSSSRVLNGATDTRDYAEPWLLWQGGTTFLMAARYGTAGVVFIKSTNSGAAWTAAGQLFAGYSGRPTLCLLSSGTIIMILRSLSDGSGWYTYTKNVGTNWYPPRKMGISMASGTSQTYAQPIEIAYGIAFCPVGFEQAYTSNSSRLYGTYLIEGSGVSPLGDISPDAKAAIVDDTDQILLAEDFQRPDGALGAPWTVAQGSLSIASGQLVSGSPDATPDKAWFECRTPDVSIEADLMFNGGAQAGFGIITRFVDINNYIMISFETLTGAGTALYPASLNIYRYLSGTLYRWQSGAWSATLSTPTLTIGGASTPPPIVNSWSKVKVECRGASIIVKINDVFMTWINDQADAGQAIGNATKHGVMLNPASTFQQYCRRVLIKA
jgi:hypothetical protein